MKVCELIESLEKANPQMDVRVIVDEHEEATVSGAFIIDGGTTLDGVFLTLE